MHQHRPDRGSAMALAAIRLAPVGEQVKLEYCDLHDSIIGDYAVVRKTTGTVNVGDRSQINSV